MMARQAPARALGLVAMLLTLALGGCGAISSVQNTPTATSESGVSCVTSQTIELDFYYFNSQCVIVISNQQVTFDDPVYNTTTATGGAHHIICVGEGSVCDTNPDVPKDLESPGFEIFPGQRHVVIFTKPGIYDITCTLHPMTMQVVVK
jgi:hypothetical protein